MARNQVANVLTGLAGLAAIIVGSNNVRGQVYHAETMRERGPSVLGSTLHFIGDQPNIINNLIINPPDVPQKSPAEQALVTADFNVLVVAIGAATLTASLAALRK